MGRKRNSGYTVSKRSGSQNYYARIQVPPELRSKFNKAEIWRSLGTADHVLADRKSWSVFQEFHELFKSFASTGLPPDKFQIQEATWNRYVALIQHDELFRRKIPTSKDLHEIWKYLTEEYGDDQDLEAYRIFRSIAEMHQENIADRKARLALLKDNVARGEIDSVNNVIDTIARDQNFDLLPDSEERRNFAQLLQRSEIEALKRSMERDEGDFGGQIKDPAVRPPSSSAPVVAAPGESIMELFEAFAGDNPNRSQPETLAQSRAVIELFSQFVGTKFPVANISKKEIREWKTALQHYPTRAKQTAAFRGMDFRRAVEANKRIKKAGISDKTRNRYLAALGSYCHWLMTNGYISSVPTAGMFTKLDKTEQIVFPYSSEQLQTLFRSPLYSGFQSIAKEHVSGDIVIRDHKFWLPLISLFTGARMGEICQLLVNDIIKTNEQWIFSLTTEGAKEKRLKTKGSKRNIPIHPTLIDIGILDHLKRMRAQKQSWLFPEIELDNRNSRSGKYSRFYGRYIQRIGLKFDKSLNFHSLRHSFTDALRRAGHLDDEFKFLLGHTQRTVTGRYGILAEGDLKRRVMLIESVDYPGLDLSALYTE